MNFLMVRERPGKWKRGQATMEFHRGENTNRIFFMINPKITPPNSTQLAECECESKTIEYIAQRCQRCISCDRLVDITGTKVIKIRCPMCKSTWCMLCQQRWNVHGAHTGGLQKCNFVKRKLIPAESIMSPTNGKKNGGGSDSEDSWEATERAFEAHSRSLRETTFQHL